MTIGLGRETRLDGVRIVWPSGKVLELDPSKVAIDQETEVREPP